MRDLPSNRNKPKRKRARAISFAVTRSRSSSCKAAFPSPLLLLLLLVLGVSTTRGQFQQSHEPQCKPEEPTTYDWERLNYYQLLGLTEDDDVKKKKKRKKKGHAPSNDSGPPITSKEIRKAYRKQAQKYHPDKQVSKKKASSENETQSSSSTASTTSKAMSLEESNARFAKIAEAYEFLLDDTKRKDYDLFLEYCHNTEIVTDDEVHEGRLSTVLKKRFHGLFDDLGLSRDPFKVFKDVFFGGEDDDETSYFDPNDPFSHLRYENNPQRHPHHQEQHPNEEQPYEPQEDPLRVFHDKRFMYDPFTGENVVRVLQTEEYPPSKTREAPRSNATSASSSSSSSFYYRIIAQDFQETYDPYNAKQAYVPITEPYLQEDGFRTASASRDQGTTTTSKSSSSSTVESILHPWEVLTPRSKPMVSPNKRYIAGLTPDCELLVMINPDRFDGENESDSNAKGYNGGSSSYHHNDAPPEIIWSTQRPYGTNGYAADHCYALLKGPHLVVTVGANPQQPGSSHHNSRILWHSDGRNDEDDSRQGYYEYEDEFGFWHKRQRSYLAQLDNDGSLTVYSVWSVPKDEEDHKREQQQQQHYSSRSSSHRYNNHRQQNHRLFHHHHAVDEHFKQKPKVLVSNVAKAARDMWHGRIATKNEYDHLYSKTSSLTYKRCVYSTSTHSRNLPPNVGCYRVSRKMTQLGVEATLSLRKLVFEINRWADAWLDLIYEEDDLFYFFKESIWKNSVGLSKMAGSSAKWVRKVLEGLKQLSHQYKS